MNKNVGITFLIFIVCTALTYLNLSVTGGDSTRLVKFLGSAAVGFSTALVLFFVFKAQNKRLRR